MELEQMDNFFTKRLDMYDVHMMNDVEGCREGYKHMAALLPENTKTLLDLGCGTGLELVPIFERFPRLAVTGIDLSLAMLARLQAKFPGKDLTLLCGSYIGRDFGSRQFDAAVSFETLHHLSHEAKVSVYSAVREALKEGGIYLECDFAAASQKEEETFYAENERLRREQNIPRGEICHFDTPCTAEHEIAMLRKAGFQSAEKVWQQGNTVLISAGK
jgi:cyclopropane fatty-acyl-phospholipid synthase-like methyltransferase